MKYCGKVKILIVLTFFIGLMGCSDKKGMKMKVSDVFPEKETQELIKLASKGKLEAVVELKSKGVDIDVLGDRDTTPLEWLLLMQDKKGFEILLKAGADPNVNPKRAQAVTVVAAAMKEPIYLKLLMQHGANPDIIAARGQTPLMKAVVNHRLKNIDVLLDHGADIEKRGGHGNTALLYAGMMGEFIEAQHLLKKGADFTKIDIMGGTLAYSVHKANLKEGSEQYNAKEDVRKFLIEKGVFFPPEYPIEVRKRLKLLEFSGD